MSDKVHMEILQEAKHILKLSLPEPVVQAIKVHRYAKKISKAKVSDGPPEFQVIAHLVDPGDTVIDIGANMGLYTKLFSDLVEPGGRVISIEPLQSNFRVLTSVVRRARLRGVSPLNCALSDSDTEAIMVIPKLPNGEDNIYEAYISERTPDSGKAVGVRCLKLDSLLSEASPSRIAFIKCDVEGHEFPVLNGGAEWIQQQRPPMFVELSGDPKDPKSSVRSVFALTESWEYRAFVQNDDRLVHTPSPLPPVLKTRDYFFLTSAHATRLAQHHVRVEGIESGNS